MAIVLGKENQLNQYLSIVAIFEEHSYQHILEVDPYSFTWGKWNKTGKAGQHSPNLVQIITILVKPGQLECLQDLTVHLWAS